MPGIISYLSNAFSCCLSNQTVTRGAEITTTSGTSSADSDNGPEKAQEDSPVGDDVSVITLDESVQDGDEADMDIAEEGTRQEVRCMTPKTLIVPRMPTPPHPHVVDGTEGSRNAGPAINNGLIQQGTHNTLDERQANWECENPERALEFRQLTKSTTPVPRQILLDAQANHDWHEVTVEIAPTAELRTPRIAPTDHTEVRSWHPALKQQVITDILERAAAHWANIPLRKKQAEFAKTMWEMNCELINMYPEPELALHQQLEETDGGSYKNISRFLVFPQRLSYQEELIPALESLRDDMRSHLQVHNRILAQPNEKNTDPKVAATWKRQLSDFLVDVGKSRTITLAVMHQDNHWLGVVGDNRGETPKYYVFNTNHAHDKHDKRKEQEKYIALLGPVSNGRIRADCFQYFGYSMQQHTPNACGELVFSMLEQVALKSKESTGEAIETLFEACFNEWNDWSMQNGEEAHKARIRELRARIMAHF